MTDHEDCILFTNTGEGDPTLARANVKCLICNDHYRGAWRRRHSCFRAGVAARMVAFHRRRGRQRSCRCGGSRRVLGTQHESTRVTNALFRFQITHRLKGSTAGAGRGAAHGAFTLGDFSERIQHVAGSGRGVDLV
jgi:hypothetical protein